MQIERPVTPSAQHWEFVVADLTAEANAHDRELVELTRKRDALALDAVARHPRQRIARPEHHFLAKRTVVVALHQVPAIVRYRPRRPKVIRRQIPPSARRRWRRRVLRRKFALRIVYVHRRPVRAHFLYPPPLPVTGVLFHRPLPRASLPALPALAVRRLPALSVIRTRLVNPR